MTEREEIHFYGAMKPLRFARAAKRFGRTYGLTGVIRPETENHVYAVVQGEKEDIETWERGVRSGHMTYIVKTTMKKVPPVEGETQLVIDRSDFCAGTYTERDEMIASDEGYGAGSWSSEE